MIIKKKNIWKIKWENKKRISCGLEHSCGLGILTVLLQAIAVSTFPTPTDTAFSMDDTRMHRGHKPVSIRAGRREGKGKLERPGFSFFCSYIYLEN